MRKLKNNSRPLIRILAIGNELLNGAISDTNTAALCRFFEERGAVVERSALVRDKEPEIEAELARAVLGADLVITTGGLGPTSDDLTRSVIASFARKPLKEDAAARLKLEALFAARKRPMNETNLRQVFFPQGATILENSLGTADSFVTWVEQTDGEQTPILSLPGIPRELKHLLAEKVAPWLESELPMPSPTLRRYLRSFGRSESYLGKKIEELRLPETVEVAYRPMFPEILLTFSESRVRSPEVEEELDAVVKSVRQAIGEEFFFGTEPSVFLPQTLAELLKARGKTLALAESCTGGLLSDLLVSLPGSSTFYRGGVVSYANGVKAKVLSVSSESLRAHGAVSAIVAQEMAVGARTLLEADIALSITGVAGPDGGTPEKPVGTAWIGIADANGVQAVPHFYAIERNMFRAFCASAALDLLRRRLLDLPLEWQRM